MPTTHTLVALPIAWRLAIAWHGGAAQYWMSRLVMLTFVPHRYRRLVWWLAGTAIFLGAIITLTPRETIDTIGFYAAQSIKAAEAWDHHPALLLHQRAEIRQRRHVQHQSTSFQQAESEYVRRYEVAPPVGFHEWFAYAVSKGSPIIDDFDMPTRAVHRYLNWTASELAQRIAKATAEGDGRYHHDRVGSCSFADGTFSKGCRHFGKPLADLLGDALRYVSNTTFLLNFLDEPSVLTSPSEFSMSDSKGWRDLSHSSIMPAIRDACIVRGNVSHPIREKADIDTYGLPFVVGDIAASRDLCQHFEYGNGHGFLMAPTTFRQMQMDIPVLSQAVPHPFADIPYPSTHYGIRSSMYTQWHDRFWFRKKNAVYWTGATTGGAWSTNNWQRGHRQRLVALVSRHSDRLYTLLRPTAGTSYLEPYASHALDRAHFDVWFTKVQGCGDDTTCTMMNEFYSTPRRSEHDSRPFAYRYVLDIDGNSYSGRFYRFLASRSVPLKISIFQEWHDERLVPWLHYIPVSQSMEELPELMRFLTTTRQGQLLSLRIAQAGRDWYFAAMTPVHQGIYLYRLMIELARLQDPSRLAS